jgi:hypothetical protein
MKFCFALIAALALPIGCGDNSDECGPGTHAVDGVCTPDGNGSGTTCSGGTKLDPATGSCVVDPNDCQDGTVLVGNQCVDPGHVTADVEEAAEPNGLGLFGEDSNGAAGAITLKPIGQHVVVHGKIIPFEDNDGDGQTDPDIDTYVVTVTAPTLVHVSADGLHGLTAGFVSLAAVDQNDPLANWERIGANLTGDTSKRQLFLPGAGTYAIAITDSRTLILNSSVASGAADGDPDFEYYVTLDQLAIPAPTALAVTANEATSTGTLNPGEPKFFTVPMGTGFNSVTLDDDGTNYTESVVVTNTRGSTNIVKTVADGDPSTGAAAAASTIGFVTGDSSLVVADAVVDYSTDPTNYTLTVDTTDAGALSKTGGNVTQPSNATNFTLFYYDVASTDEITGMKLHFDKPVGGVIVGENDFIFSYFTYDPNFGFVSDFTDYDGLIRHPTAGRYYFFTLDLTLTGSQTGTITATSTYAPVTPVAVTEGTVTASQTPDATYHTNAFTYNAGTTDDWQQFAATGGTVSSRFYDPTTGYGRLSPFGADATGCFDNTDPTNDFCDQDAAAIWEPTLTGGAKGHILLDDGTRNYLVVTRPSASFTLDFRVRPYTALAPTAGGAAVTDHGTLDTTTTLKRYLVKTAASNQLHVDVTPTAMDAVITSVDSFENPTATIDEAVGALVEHLATISTGWTALTVSAVTPAAGQSFDLSATALAAVAYTKTAGTTAFADACTGGTTVTMSDPDEGMSNSTIAAPTGFKLFGLASPTFRVFSNGFIGFDGTTCADDPFGLCFFFNSDLPDGGLPNAIVAPFWGDLDLTSGSVCTKTSGTKRIVQWEGTHFGDTALVKVQAIIDGATSTIEFVYAADHDAANDGSQDTVGIESAAGVSAYKVGFLDSVITPGTAILLTPN